MSHSRASQDETLRWILEQLIRERTEGLPGADAASTQLAHLMFIHILRGYLRRDGVTAPSWLRRPVSTPS
ncbi:cupin domain-containing protein [Paraburkholderia flagellata]|uniref:cupin domain-containing protein n=1 Tax=Paraburkholderia flagellata TaxID=2883241 RepID=UPI001F1876B8|nr:cupin domain-containing protein [Paraburkholderia flagellata]